MFLSLPFSPSTSSHPSKPTFISWQLPAHIDLVSTSCVILSWHWRLNLCGVGYLNVYLISSKGLLNRMDGITSESVLGPIGECIEKSRYSESIMTDIIFRLAYIQLGSRSKSVSAVVWFTRTRDGICGWGREEMEEGAREAMRKRNST